MPDSTYDIQELMTQSGVPRRTIHFYVQQNILPPPQGAGLAARYSEEHLLRLRLIPLLRRQGLRLDDIRDRFQQMSVDEMRKVAAAPEPAASVTAASAPAASAPAPSASSAAEDPAGDSAVQSLLRRINERPMPFTAPAGWEGQRYTVYTLPAGINLSAPETLSPVDRQRLNQLLQAARQIFGSTAQPFVTWNKTNPGPPSSGPEDGNSESAQKD